MPGNIDFLDLNRFRLAAAQVPSALLPRQVQGTAQSTAVDIDIAEGNIVAVAPSGESKSELPLISLKGRQVWPCFVDIHTHLDKGHTWNRAPNPDGTFQGAIKAIAADRVHWTPDDMRRRMEFGLAASYAHGTRAIRTHLDSLGDFAAKSWPLYAELRREWSGRIELQAACLVSIEYFRDKEAGGRLADLVAKHQGVLGAVVYVTADLDDLLDRIVQLATERGLDLDFHTDENGDPNSNALLRIAKAVVRNKFKDKVLCGHACSLAVQSAENVEKTMNTVAEVGMGIVSLPMCNMYIQDRSFADDASPRTPHWRGVTLLHELRSRGIPVALASDNVRDAFHPYGDHDLLEVFSFAAKVAHLDRPFGDWPAAVTRTPAHLMRLAGSGMIAPGNAADLIIFSSCDIDTMLCRGEPDRIVLRNGKRITAQLPDYERGNI
ncbi:MAG: cytosine deaminase [Burkholderiales bacterium]